MCRAWWSGTIFYSVARLGKRSVMSMSILPYSHHANITIVTQHTYLHHILNTQMSNPVNVYYETGPGSSSYKYHMRPRQRIITPNSSLQASPSRKGPATADFHLFHVNAFIASPVIGQIPCEKICTTESQMARPPILPSTAFPQKASKTKCLIPSVNPKAYINSFHFHINRTLQELTLLILRQGSLTSI